VLNSVPASVRLSLFSTCSLCVTPFVLWACTTIGITTAAVVMILLGRHRAHGDFMIRSYALMYGFLLVRLYAHMVGTPLEVPLPGGVDRASMVIWLAWVVPLLCTETLLSWGPMARALSSRRSRTGNGLS
jgi:hypothetical protein